MSGPPSQSPTTLGRSEEDKTARYVTMLWRLERETPENAAVIYIQVNKQEMARQHYHRCGNLMSLLKDQRSTLIPTVLHIAPTIYFLGKL